MQVKLYESDDLKHRNPSGADIEAVVDRVDGHDGKFVTLEFGDFTVQAAPGGRGSWTVQVIMDRSVYFTTMDATDEVKRFLVQVLWGDHGPDSPFGSEDVAGHTWQDISKDVFGSNDLITDETRGMSKIAMWVLGGYVALTFGCLATAYLLGRDEAVHLLRVPAFMNIFVFAGSLLYRDLIAQYWQEAGRQRFRMWNQASARANRHVNGRLPITLIEFDLTEGSRITVLGGVILLSLIMFIIGVAELLLG